MGEDVVLLVTSERDTEVELRGGIDVGRGGGAGRVEVSASKNLGLEIVGGAGPIGLNLCRVRLGGAPALAFGELEDSTVDGELDNADGCAELLEVNAAAEPLDDPELGDDCAAFAE